MCKQRTPLIWGCGQYLVGCNAQCPTNSIVLATPLASTTVILCKSSILFIEQNTVCRVSKTSLNNQKPGHKAN